MAWPYLGDICLKLDDLPRARQAYDQAPGDVSPGPVRRSARFGLGRTLALLGDPEGGRKVLQTLVEHGSPEWTDRAWLQIGQILANSGQSARAVEAFETLERVAPRSLLVAESRLDRAKALLQLGRSDEAEPLLRVLAAEGPAPLATQAALELRQRATGTGPGGQSTGDPGRGVEAFAAIADNRCASLPVGRGHTEAEPGRGRSQSRALAARATPGRGSSRRLRAIPAIPGPTTPCSAPRGWPWRAAKTRPPAAWPLVSPRGSRRAPCAPTSA